MTDINLREAVTLDELQSLRNRLSPPGTVNACYWIVTALISERLNPTQTDRDLRYARQTIKRRQAREG